VSFPRGGPSSATRCGDATCDYGARCDANTNRCVCPDSDADCDPYTTDIDIGGAAVCGSDGNTYRSECHLLQYSCRYKLHILITSYTPCRSE
jgi:hypothetical protein